MGGVLDKRGIKAAREAMGWALSARPRLVVLELDGVTRLEGTGVVLLAAMRRHARRAGARMSLVDSGGRRSVSAGGLASTLPIYGSLTAALGR